ncbi:uncharacterized protein [Watersipora subatra]|uniref:uncharacterized protein n=1 Tax=Watersipora subatra TaxID=2589382 RepID=UPI00355C3E03
MQSQLCVLLLVISQAAAARHDGICIKTKPTPGSKPFPPIPDVYSVDIQMNMQLKKSTRHLFELFDAPNSRAIIGETLSSGPFNNISETGYDIYNFNTNQIVEVVELPDTSFSCTASPLDGRPKDTFMFGSKASSKNGFTAKTAFQIDPDYPPIYQGTETLQDGVLAEKWSDCVYIIAMDATLKVMWYFTASNWNSSIGDQVPVMLTVEGMAYDPETQGRPIKHTYTFTGFSDFLPDTSLKYFMVPPRTVCPFLKDFAVGPPGPVYVPNVASQGYFSFQAEYVQQAGDGAGLVTNIKEYYDNTLHMSRYDYIPEGMLASFFTANSDNPISEIHDFITGLAYITDKVHGNCSVMTLTDSPSFDVLSTDMNHARMKTIAEFFGLFNSKGSNMTWTYTGPRMVRDVLANVFAAEKFGYPPHAGADTKSVWEIAFMTKSYFDVNEGAAIEYSEPMQIYVKIPKLGYEMSYNIFDFNEEEPNIWVYDISKCFTDDQKWNVQFKLPGDQKKKIKYNYEMFNYFLYLNIIKQAKTLSSRVANVRWTDDDSDEDITVQFQLIDLPTLPGSTRDKLSADAVAPTSTIVQRLKTAVENGSFVVEAGGSGNTLVAMIALPDSFHHGPVVVNNTVLLEEFIQLSAGAAAGYAIGFFIVGMGLGIFIIFLINKCRSGGAGPVLTLSFANKNFDS